VSDFRQILQLDCDTDLYIRTDEDSFINFEIETGQGKVVTCFEVIFSADEASRVAHALQLAVADCSMRGGL
jgi:hypothetical protein